MPRFIKWVRPRGTVHNVAHALAGVDEGCNILVLSDATLYVLQNLVALDITFKSRWADEVFDFGYHPITEDSANYGAWVDLVEQIQGEVVDMSCEIVPVLEDIKAAIDESTGMLADIKVEMQNLVTAEEAENISIDDLEPILDAINIILGGAAILGGA